MVNPLDQLPVSRRRILELLKGQGRATTMQLAAALSVSHEAVRKHLVELVRDGFVASDCGEAEEDVAPGRPPTTYCLTVAGDHFFPKRYDDLAALILEAAIDSGGRGVEDILGNVTEKRLARLPQASRDGIEALRDAYVKDDPFIEIGHDGGDVVIVETNCPYLTVALEQPLICSTTVSMMRNVAGFEVVREERFQDGDGRCTFRVNHERPVSARRRTLFEVEPPKPH